MSIYVLVSGMHDSYPCLSLSSMPIICHLSSPCRHCRGGDLLGCWLPTPSLSHRLNSVHRSYPVSEDTYDDDCNYCNDEDDNDDDDDDNDDDDCGRLGLQWGCCIELMIIIILMSSVLSSGCCYVDTHYCLRCCSGKHFAWTGWEVSETW